jgi:hypothetical protein
MIGDGYDKGQRSGQRQTRRCFTPSNSMARRHMRVDEIFTWAQMRWGTVAWRLAVAASPYQASTVSHGLTRAPPASRMGSQATSCPPCSPPLVELLQIAAESVPQNELGFSVVHDFMDKIEARFTAIYRASCTNS